MHTRHLQHHFDRNSVALHAGTQAQVGAGFYVLHRIDVLLHPLRTDLAIDRRRYRQSHLLIERNSDRVAFAQDVAADSATRLERSAPWRHWLNEGEAARNRQSQHLRRWRLRGAATHTND